MLLMRVRLERERALSAMVPCIPSNLEHHTMSNVKDVYKHLRMIPTHTIAVYQIPAIDALKKARDQSARAVSRVTPWAGGKPGDKVRAVANFQAFGFRRVGYSDELSRMDHRGYYLRQHDYDDVARGAVFVLSGRNGENRTFAGFIDASSGEEMAHIEMSECDRVESRTYRPEKYDYTHAANRGDQLAQAFAEASRAWDGAWQAGNSYAGEVESIKANRNALNEIRKASRAIVAPGNDVITRVMAEKMQLLRNEIGASLDKARTLAAGEFYGRECDYTFDSSDSEMRIAFNEGAGEKVL